MPYAILDDLAHQARSVIRLTGPDTRRFVQGTVTANVESMSADVAVVAALCSVKGKLVSELVVMAADDDALDLLVPRSVAAAVAEALDQHIIMDDVQVAPLREVSVAIVWNDGAGVDDPPPEVVGADILTFRARHPAPGRLVVGSVDAVANALTGMTAVDAQGWATRRIETATPAWGHEIVADRFPPEVGFVHAVAFDKGCFMGQEPLARIHARGQVNRVMVEVQGEGELVQGTALLGDDDADVGQVTTSNGGRGLAIVRRKVAEVGRTLRHGDATVTVQRGPLGDDPGIRSKAGPGTVKLGRR